MAGRVHVSDNRNKSPMDTVNELKTMLTDYARQETVGPLKLLARWVAYGVVGAFCIAIGAVYLAFALLRGLQTLDTFSGNGGSWAPYTISFAALAMCIGLATWAMTRKFSNDNQG